MPQMSYLFWVLLMAFFILIYILLSITFYYTINQKLSYYSSENPSNVLKFSLTFDM